MPPRKSNKSEPALPATSALKKIRKDFTRTLAGLGLPRPGAKAAPPPPPPLSAEEIKLAQVAGRFLAGRTDPEAQRDRAALQAAFGQHEALGDLGRGLSGLATASATAVLRSEQCLTALNDRVLSYVDEHAAGDEQLDVRFAAADLFYETVVRRSRGRKARRAGQAARLAERISGEQEKNARLLRGARLREAKLPGERAATRKEDRP